VLSLYRRLTPNARTHWESAHILGIQEARIINKTIPVKRIRYWQLFSILAAFTPSFIRSKALSLFDKIDKVVLRVPYLNRMAWIFTIELEKKLK
jgi:hypothetical protein